MNTPAINYQKVQDQIKSLHSISSKKSWITSYDAELDQFYMSPKEISSNFTLHSLGEDFLVYLDKNSNIGGIFIEYFRNNLASHDEKFKPFKQLVKEDHKLNSTNKTFLLNTLEAALLEAVTTQIDHPQKYK